MSPYHRIFTAYGPAGDRTAIMAYLTLLHGAEKPVALGAYETLILPVAAAVVLGITELVKPVMAALAGLRSSLKPRND